MGGEIAFVSLPHGALIVVFTLVLLKLFRYLGNLICGVGVMFLITPLFGNHWSSLTMGVAVVSLLIGFVAGRHFSEESPPAFLCLFVLGIAMVMMNFHVLTIGLSSFGSGSSFHLPNFTSIGQAFNAL